MSGRWLPEEKILALAPADCQNNLFYNALVGIKIFGSRVLKLLEHFLAHFRPAGSRTFEYR